MLELFVHRLMNLIIPHMMYNNGVKSVTYEKSNFVQGKNSKYHALLAICGAYIRWLPFTEDHGVFSIYVKLWVAHAPGMPGTFSPPPQFNDPDMHHGTCVTHVPWCISGSLTSGLLWSRWREKTFPAFPAHVQPAILRIWQEAHTTPYS